MARWKGSYGADRQAARMIRRAEKAIVRWCPACRAEVYVERHDRPESSFITDKGNRIGFRALAANSCPRCGTECLRQRPDAGPGETIQRTGDPAKDAELTAAARERLRSSQPPAVNPADDLYPPAFGRKP